MNCKKLLFSALSLALPLSAWAYIPGQTRDAEAEMYQGLAEIVFPMATACCAGIAVFYTVILAFFWMRQGSMQMRFGELRKDAYLGMRAKTMKYGLSVYFVFGILTYIGLVFFYSWLQNVMVDPSENFRAIVASFESYFEKDMLPRTIFVMVVTFIELSRISLAIGAVYALVIYKAWESMPRKDQPFPIILPVILIFVPIANIAAMVMNMLIMPIYMNKVFARYGTKPHWMFLASGAGVIGFTCMSIPLGFFSQMGSNLINIVAIPVCTALFLVTMAHESLRLDYLRLQGRHFKN